ncbi:hypothetical protein K7432_005745 [Basidiobolus ranarum]|uniref:Uncharacterized protein n=1 Tax=Basidiobolus ranarum TaxID=34480 RepID=A0ABR2WW31_9FUNG
MTSDDSPHALSVTSKTEGVEASCAQALTLPSFYIPTKFRLSRRRRPNSVPSKTDGNEEFISSGGKAEISKNMRSVSYDETLNKTHEHAKVSPRDIDAPNSALILENKNLAHPSAKQLDTSLPITPLNPIRKNSKMRKMSDKLQLRLLGRKNQGS